MKAGCLLWILWTMRTGLMFASSADDLAGWWHIVDEIESTSYAPYRGMRLEYRVRFRQEGAWLFGEGHKVREQGQPLGPSQPTEIAIVGTVDGRRVTATLVENGRRRESTGKFSWTLAEDATQMLGTF
jgi:hypothetical protein